MTCPRCSGPVPRARVKLGFTVCVGCSTVERKLGLLSFAHKTGGELLVGTRGTLSELTRNDRRRDRRFRLGT